jgi:DNA-binding transcriptional LysR family regulator
MLMLNPVWLRSFIALAQIGSFTRAGDQLGVTQAAISQHVRALEERLGPLLVRRGRGIELTPAGRMLLDHALEREEAERRFHQSLSGDCDTVGEITLVSPGSVGLKLYPLLLDLQRAHPGLAIHHRFAPDAEVVSTVLSGRYELGLATVLPEDPRLTITPFGRETLELVVPVGVEIHGWDDLAVLGLIDHPDGKAMARRLLGLAFPGNPGVGTLPVRGFSNQIGLILEPVARGLGFTVIPRHAREAFADQGAIRVIERGAPVVDRLWLLRRAEWPLSARAERAVAWMQRWCLE